MTDAPADPPADDPRSASRAQTPSAKSDAIKARAAEILAGLDLELPEPVIRPRIPFPPLPVDAKTKMLGIDVIIALIGSGMMPAEEMRLLGDVEIAPGVTVKARYLAWHAALREVVYVCPSGSFRRLERVVRAFRFGGDETCWSETTVHPKFPSWQRFAVELPALMTISGRERRQKRGDKFGWEEWKVRTSAGEFRLVAIDEPETEPVFASRDDAAAAADSALLGEPCLASDDGDDLAKADVAMHQRWRWVPAVLPPVAMDFRGVIV
jgi:hypothetical protein